MALIGTMSALVLGLLVGSAKSSYDTQKDELTSLSAGVVMLDGILSVYGPEAANVRQELRQVVAGAREQIWHGTPPPAGATSLFATIHRLAPRDAEQQAFKDQASAQIGEMAKTRLLMVQQRTSSVSTPLLAVVVFWLTINFVSFGLFAHPNATVATALFVCALSVAGAILLILEMDRPFEGLIRISDAPLQRALTQLNR